MRRPIQLDGPAANPAEAEAREHAGWLSKEPRSGRATAWRKRWAVLAGSELRLYKAQGAPAPESVVQLASMHVRAGSATEMRNRKELRERCVFELFPASKRLSAAAFEQVHQRRGA